MILLHFFLISLCRSAKEGPAQTPAAYPLSVSTMNIIGNIKCDSLSPNFPQDNFEKECWSDNGNATFSYTFKGIQFLIYGRHNKAGKFNLFVDNEDLGEIIERKSDDKTIALLYISDIYNYV